MSRFGGTHTRLFTAVALSVLFAAGGRAEAQQRDTALDSRPFPRDVARSIESRWNATTVAIRASRSTQIDSTRDVTGDVVIRDANLTIRGHVTGNVLAIDGNVELHPGARVDGDIWVIGGMVRGRDDATIRGELRVYQQGMVRYRTDGDRIIVTEADTARWGRLGRRERGNASMSIMAATAGVYNRVEGLPIRFGPSLRAGTPWGGYRFDALAIVRTASSFSPDNGDVGHDVRGEVQFGGRRYVGIGGRLFNVVDPVESSNMSRLENSLSAGLYHRDYYDYYERHGGGAYATLVDTKAATVTLSFTDERWQSRGLRDPFTLFRGSTAWRPSPLMDEGRMHLATASLEVDTRNVPNGPSSGWWVKADLEHGAGTLSSLAPMTTGRLDVRGAPIRYGRGFIDARRYDRLSPNAQLSFRAVLGGWLNGDELPMQRRLSVDGPGSLPGFDFRTTHGTGADVSTCTASGANPGLATECERVALAQIEYRGSLHFGGGSDWRNMRDHIGAFDDGMTWVMFADAGRGWLVGPRAGDLRYPRSALPPLSTFRTDLGLGVDLGGLGLYAAKAVSDPSESTNFFVRVRRRF
jgi:hypothetical protein